MSQSTLFTKPLILAGDVGGTKCTLGLFQEEASLLRVVFCRRLVTRDYPTFHDLVFDFFRQAEEMLHGPVAERIGAAGFGATGALVDGCHLAVNLPWNLDAAALARKLGLHQVVMLNDLTATAFALEKLPSEDLLMLNEGVPRPDATKALIAAGTGLGEAVLFWDGRQHRIAPSEGGLADFAPRTDRELQLLQHLKQRLPYVSSEDILSGRGFRRIHEFLDPYIHHASFEGAEADAASEIAERAQAQSCAVCVETVDMWTNAYGVEAGNLALRTLAFGGVYVAGGIAPKIVTKLKDGSFARSFCGESKLAPELARIPIYVVLNPDAPLWGAAYHVLAARTS